MPEIKILRGAPASGKSTYALEWVQRGTNRVRINRDDIRFTNFGAYTGVDEQAVTVLEDATLVAAMKASLDIVLDATNLNAKFLKGKIKLAHKWGYTVTHEDFDVARDELKLRDSMREKKVGDSVIDSFYDRYLRKGFPLFPEVEAPLEFRSYNGTPGMPKAIIVDIDGTLAHMNDRSPYDDKRLHEDTVDDIVRDIVSRYEEDHGIVVMSGRDEGKCRTATEAWLERHGIYHDWLIMRPAGDVRNDAVVKNELFENYVAKWWDVKFALDDRDRVVDMWRAKGIKTLQCEPGDF